MRHILAIAALCLAALTARAQTVEIVSGSTTRIFLEKTLASDNATTFAYMEATFGGGVYGQFFQEVKFWKAPVFLHGEYRTTFDGNHTAIVGPSLAIYSKHGLVTIAPFYRYDFGINKSAFQLGNSYFYEFGPVEFYGYNDLWYNGDLNYFGEQRIHLRLTEHFKLGFILDLSYFGEFAAAPALGVRFDF